MAFCRKCGHQLYEGAAFCQKCGERTISSVVPAEPAIMAQEKSPIPDPTVIETTTTINAQETVENITQDTTESIAEEKTDKKSKKLINTAKTKLKENGKTAAVNFVIKKILTNLIVVIVSVCTTFFVQSNFKGDFKKYYNETLMPMQKQAMEVAQFADLLQKTTSTTEIVQYYEENDIKNKTIDALKVAYAYSSENEDIMKIHNLFIGYYEEILNLSETIHAAAVLQSQSELEIPVGYVYSEYKAGVDKLKIKNEIIDEEVAKMVKKYKIKNK